VKLFAATKANRRAAGENDFIKEGQRQGSIKRASDMSGMRPVRKGKQPGDDYELQKRVRTVRLLPADALPAALCFAIRTRDVVAPAGTQFAAHRFLRQ